MIQQLSEAIVKNNHEEFQKILAGVTLKKIEIEELFHLVIQQQSIPILNMLCTQYHTNFQKLFIVAAGYNKVLAVKYLLNLKNIEGDNLVDIDQKDGWAYSAVLNAIEHNAIQTLGYLIKQGAKIDEEALCRIFTTVKDEQLYTECLKIALKALLPINWNEILMAALSNKSISPQVIDLLLKQGAKADYVSKDRKTPLMMAAQGKNPAVLMLLLNNGAQKTINDTSKYGYTALVYAAQANINLSVMMLVRYGADVNKHGKVRSPLMHAAMQGNATLVEFLVKKGADVEYLYEEKNCLFMAIESKCVLTVEALVEQRRKLLTSSYDEKTVMEYAILKKAIEVAKYLAEQGAALELIGTTPCKNSIEHEILNYSNTPKARQFSTYIKKSPQAFARPLSRSTHVRPALTLGYQRMRNRIGTPLTAGLTPLTTGLRALKRLR